MKKCLVCGSELKFIGDDLFFCPRCDSYKHLAVSDSERGGYGVSSTPAIQVGSSGSTPDVRIDKSAADVNQFGKAVFRRSSSQFQLSAFTTNDGSKGLELVETSFRGENRELLLTHYAGSESVIGRQICYDIFYRGRKIGIIGGQSVSMPMLPVVRYVFRSNHLTKEIKMQYFEHVMNNNIFRMDSIEKNLASRVLAVWVRQFKLDMKRKYGVELKAIISMSYGTRDDGSERTGKCYKAANWKYLGKSQGTKRIQMNPIVIVKDVPKHLWCWKYKEKTRRSRSSASLAGTSDITVKGDSHEVRARDNAAHTAAAGQAGEQ